MIVQTNFASDLGHWYDKDGNPAYTIIGKNGKERPTTLRDARKHGLLPSVTTILKVAAKPGLDQWKQQQVLLAALTLPKVENESEQDYISRIIHDSQEQAKNAAQRGALIHGEIERFYFGFVADESEFNYALGVDMAISNHFGQQDWRPEKSFATDSYGGKVDLHSDDVVIDFKTKEFTEDKLPEAYDENLMQLAAYRKGLGIDSARCANVFVSVNKPGLVHIVEHSEDALARAWLMFDALLNFWTIKNKFI